MTWKASAWRNLSQPSSFIIAPNIKLISVGKKYGDFHSTVLEPCVSVDMKTVLGFPSYKSDGHENVKSQLTDLI